MQFRNYRKRLPDKIHWNRILSLPSRFEYWPVRLNNLLKELFHCNYFGILAKAVSDLFQTIQMTLGRVKRIWYLSPMRAAKVQASLRIRTVSPEPPLLAQTSSESRGTFRQKARSLAPLNGWACAVKICHDGMLEDTNSLDGAHTGITQKDVKPVSLSLTRNSEMRLDQHIRCGQI